MLLSSTKRNGSSEPSGATSINNNKYLITYLIKEYGQMHFIQECIVNSQNVFNCVYVQADNLIQYEENLPFPPRFLLLQHLAVDVNALTRNVFTCLDCFCVLVYRLSSNS